MTEKRTVLLWINGLTNFLGYRSSRMPQPGKLYWGSRIRHIANNYFQSDETHFINGEGGFFTSAKFRFDKGYNDTLSRISQYQDKEITFISHSQGGAYSEGMAKALFEHDIPVKLGILLQPSSAAFIPQEIPAIQKRIFVQNDWDFVANKFSEKIDFADIYVRESEEKEFAVYTIKRTKDEKEIIMKRKTEIDKRFGHISHRIHPEILWEAIETSINFLNKS